VEPGMIAKTTSGSAAASSAAARMTINDTGIS
jgi:hypothetical protein